MGMVDNYIRIILACIHSPVSVACMPRGIACTLFSAVYIRRRYDKKTTETYPQAEDSICESC